MTRESASKVLVTGATGLIAQHCIIQLLEAGYTVRGTARSRHGADGIALTLSPHLSPSARQRLETTFQLVEADLLKDDGWDDAVEGCRYVLHVASPIPRVPPKNENQLIEPAREGTLRVMRAAHRAGVERVVVTSSLAAVLYGQDRDRIFTENDWSNVDDPRIGAYEKSKTIAERAAWDFMASLGTDAEMSLATINPGLVMGPVLSSDWGTSGEIVKKIIDRDFPAIPDINYACVDVRDVASAHIAAMTVPDAADARFLCANGNHSMRSIARILKEHLEPQGYRIPTGNLPSVMLRLVALWDKTARLALNDLGVEQNVDTSRIRSALNWEPRDLREMVTSMADSMIEHGIVKPKK